MRAQPSSRRFWKNLALTLLAGSLLGLVAPATYIVNLASQATRNALRPPQSPITQTPLAVGIDQYTDVVFTTADDVELHGWYLPPQPDQTTVIVLLHGYASNRQSLLPEAKRLNQSGYGVLMFDFRGHGESGAAQVTLGDKEQLDLTAAIEWALRQPQVERLGALGFSVGGAVLAEVAARDPRLEAVVIEAAFPTLEDEIRYRAGSFGWLSALPAFYALDQAGVEWAQVRPLEAVCQISPRPVLLIYGDLDVAVPAGTGEAMQAAACGSAELWLVAGADHDTLGTIVLDTDAARLASFFAP